ncbi:MAG TPA: tRNA dihydrouridine synthase DusB, partial [Candidatus Gastranaerophilales bacterium]|nr:tRNA dihydrouridine synthase DusB [Candidatus Gastranaerophilales bacterium]
MHTKFENQKRLKKLTIENINFDSCVILAPMAGITDTVLRQVVRLFSAKCLLMSEMISSESLKHNNEKYLLDHEKLEFPLAFQISGHKPEFMAEAAQKLERISTFIDINMGCPAPKIIKNFDGARLMTDLKLASKIITTVKNAVKVPVTVKCRLGWDHDSKNHVEFAKMAETSGANAIIVHGRTRSQMYAGKSDWHAIGEVKNAVNIPVIGNGDIISPETAVEYLDISGCDGIAVGRGILGDPGLIGRIENYIDFGKLEPSPDIKTRLEIALIHCKKQVEHRGEDAGVKYMRKFFAHYVKNIKNAGKYRFDLVTSESLSEVESIFEKILKD